jgi:hypothetical protein
VLSTAAESSTAYKRLNDGIAINNNTIQGIIVQTISSTVLCCIVDGVEILLLFLTPAEKINSQSSQLIKATIQINQKTTSWCKSTIPSTIGVAEFWKPNCHSRGASENKLNPKNTIDNDETLLLNNNFVFFKSKTVICSSVNVFRA